MGLQRMMLNQGWGGALQAPNQGGVRVRPGTQNVGIV